MTTLQDQIQDGFNQLEAKMQGNLDAKMAEYRKEVDAEIRDLSQQACGYKGAAAEAINGEPFDRGDFVKTAASRMFEMREEIEKGAQIKLELPVNTLLTKAANLGAATPATGTFTSDVPRYDQGGMGMPGGYRFGIHHSIPTIVSKGIDKIKYLRYDPTAVAGSVSVVPEGSTKPYVSPSFTPIEASAMTLAGLSKISEQALSSRPQMERVFNQILVNSLSKCLDNVLYAGNATPSFEGYSKLAYKFTSSANNLPDAITEATFGFGQYGLNPDVILVNYADWFSVVTAKSTQGVPLIGGYLADISEPSIRGVRVQISEAVPVGKALLVDTSQLSIVADSNAVLVGGRTGDDWETNKLTFRFEQTVGFEVYNTRAICEIALKA